MSCFSAFPSILLRRVQLKRLDRVASIAAGRVATEACAPAPSRLQCHASNFSGHSARFERRRLARLSPHRRFGTTLACEWIADGRVMKSAEGVCTEGKEVVVFLHGLLGNAKNLRSPAKRLTKRLPGFNALLVDIRGHGASSGPFPRPHNFESCVRDISDTLSTIGLTGPASPAAICGHSLGGRIALQYSHSLGAAAPRPGDGARDAIAMPRQTWVLDSVPGRADPSVHGVLRAVSSLQPPFLSKAWVVERLMQSYSMERGLASWIATNLRVGEDELHHWVFDLAIANELVENFPDQDLIGMIREVTSQGEPGGSSAVRLVRAGKNKSWTEDIVSELESIPAFGKEASSLFRMHTLEKAGHWVHVDDLNGLVELMVEGLQR